MPKLKLQERHGSTHKEYRLNNSLISRTRKTESNQIQTINKESTEKWTMMGKEKLPRCLSMRVCFNCQLDIIGNHLRKRFPIRDYLDEVGLLACPWDIILIRLIDVKISILPVSLFDGLHPGLYSNRESKLIARKHSFIHAFMFSLLLTMAMTRCFKSPHWFKVPVVVYYNLEL